MLLSYLLAPVAVGLGMYYVIGALFERRYYRRRRAEAARWKCQPERWPTDRMRRQDLALGTANLVAGSLLSGLLAYHVATGGKSGIYLDLRRHGLVFTLAGTLLYFLLTDAGLYFAHRLLHRPALFRRIHRWHHRNTVPTAFTAHAMHPAEFFLYQAIMLLPALVFPIYYLGLIVLLLYQNCVALVDHSGIRFRSHLPWQPPPLFHDDHHRYFHVNYGQNLGLWDRLFGTQRRVGRRYGIDVFGGRGAPEDHDGPAGGPPRYVEYQHAGGERA